MAGKGQHVVPHKGMWGVKGAGNGKYTGLYVTQSQAIGVGRGIAQNQKSELLIHGKDGKIRSKDSYGNDPIPPKDSEN